MNKSNKIKGPDIEHVLFESGKRIVLTHAGDTGKAETAGKILQEGSAYADHIIMQLEKSRDASSEIACKAGCPYCCSMQISITPPEAIVLGVHVVENYGTAAKNDLLKKINHNIRLTYKKTQDEKIENWRQTPCIFLKGGSCSVYVIRPFVCRSWHSLDVRQCIDSWRSKDKEAEIDSLFHRNYVYGMVRKGVQKGCEMLGLQWETQVVTSAVKSYLAHPNPLEGWLRGEQVFKPG